MSNTNNEVKWEVNEKGVMEQTIIKENNIQEGVKFPEEITLEKIEKNIIHNTELWLHDRRDYQKRYGDLDPNLSVKKSCFSCTSFIPKRDKKEVIKQLTKKDKGKMVSEHIYCITSPTKNNNVANLCRHIGRDMQPIMLMIHNSKLSICTYWELNPLIYREGVRRKQLKELELDKVKMKVQVQEKSLSELDKVKKNAKRIRETLKENISVKHIFQEDLTSKNISKEDLKLKLKILEKELEE